VKDVGTSHSSWHSKNIALFSLKPVESIAKSSSLNLFTALQIVWNFFQIQYFPKLFTDQKHLFYIPVSQIVNQSIQIHRYKLSELVFLLLYRRQKHSYISHNYFSATISFPYHIFTRRDRIIYILQA